MLIDLHTHTFPQSDDSFISLANLVTEAKRAGLDGLCVTEHDRFWDPARLQSLSRKHDFLLFPGCEVTTEKGHLLVFGLCRYTFGMHRAAFVRSLVDELGGAIIIAHPYRRRFRRNDTYNATAYNRTLEQALQSPYFSLADGIEVLNGRGAVEENAFALEISSRLNLRGTGASDAHGAGEVGSCATEFERPVHTLEALIQELRDGSFRAVSLQEPTPTPG